MAPHSRGRRWPELVLLLYLLIIPVGNTVVIILLVPGTAPNFAIEN